MNQAAGVRASGYNPHPDWDVPWAEVGLPPAGAPKPPKRLGYVAQEGVIALSYSRLNTLYSCPRKFQLSELMGRKSFSPTMHTAFGHAYGAGVQTFLQYAPSPPAAEAFMHDLARSCQHIRLRWSVQSSGRWWQRWQHGICTS